MTIEILDKAEDDLVEGFHFYEKQQPGLGRYFLASLYSDIESLHWYGGIHRTVYREYHRLLSKRFPFAVFYKVADGTIFIYARRGLPPKSGLDSATPEMMIHPRRSTTEDGALGVGEFFVERCGQRRG